MSFAKEYEKAYNMAGSFAKILGLGQEEELVKPAPEKSGYIQQADIPAKAKKVEGKNFFQQNWEKIPETYRPIVGIAGAMTAVYLITRIK